MGFGFSDIPEEETGPKIKYKLTDKLTYYEWDKLLVDMRVQSILTGTMGHITELSPEWQQVSIAWDNGKTSCYQHRYLTNVIVI